MKITHNHQDVVGGLDQIQVRKDLVEEDIIAIKVGSMMIGMKEELGLEEGEGPQVEEGLRVVDIQV